MAEARRHYVIVNPTSGGGAGARMRNEVSAALARRGLHCAAAVTEAPGHAVELARAAAADGCDVVVAVGGDGTVHEVSNGILLAREAQPDIPAALGVVPVGTGNDFVKMLPELRSRAGAYNALGNGRQVSLDAGRVSWPGGSEYFVNAAGTGIDVEVVRQIARDRSRAGGLTYLRGLVRAIRSYRPVAIELKADGVARTGRVMTVAIAIGRCVGGAFRLTPDAVPDDGFFDICVVGEMPILRSVHAAGRILVGRHGALPEVTMMRARRAEVVFTHGIQPFLQLDGELREPAGTNALALEACPLALRVVAGATVGS